MSENKNQTHCRDLLECDVRITKDFFKRICSTEAYVNCHHFAKRGNQLKSPMEWVQWIAIELDAKASPEDEISENPEEVTPWKFRGKFTS